MWASGIVGVAPRQRVETFLRVSNKMGNAEESRDGGGDVRPRNCSQMSWSIRAAHHDDTTGQGSEPPVRICNGEQHGCVERRVPATADDGYPACVLEILTGENGESSVWQLVASRTSANTVHVVNLEAVEASDTEIRSVASGTSGS